MSYILEALKKADAAREREREAIPGLHSRHDHALPDDAEDRGEPSATQAARTPWLVGGVAGGVVIAGALFWLLGRPGADDPHAGQTRPMPLQGQVGEAPPVPTLPAQPARDPVMAQQPAPAVQAPPVLAQAPMPAQARPASPPEPTVQATPPTTQPTRVPPSVPPTLTPAAAPTTRPTPVADPLRVDPALRETGPKVVSIQELPDDIRRELPPLSVGGAMHSDVAANRMLVLNGGVFREGDQPAPGVVLEEIRLKSAVLRYKGHRYSISY